MDIDRRCTPGVVSRAIICGTYWVMCVDAAAHRGVMFASWVRDASTRTHEGVPERVQRVRDAVVLGDAWARGR